MTALLEALLAGRIEALRAAADMMGEGLPARLDWLEAWLGAADPRRDARRLGRSSRFGRRPCCKGRPPK